MLQIYNLLTKQNNDAPKIQPSYQTKQWCSDDTTFLPNKTMMIQRYNTLTTQNNDAPKVQPSYQVKQWCSKEKTSYQTKQ